MKERTDFPVLETERLILRQLRESDAIPLYELRSNEEVSKHYVANPRAYTVESALRHIRSVNDDSAGDSAIVWTITSKGEDRFIGSICLWNISRDRATGEIGYELSPRWHGKGIMREALLKVVEYGFFTMGLQVIEAFPHPGNESSVRLLERNGFSRRDDFKTVRDVTDNLVFVIENPGIGKMPDEGQHAEQRNQLECFMKMP